MTRLARKLNRRVQVQNRALDPDEGVSYSTVATVWAGLKPVAAGKPVAGVQEHEAVTHQVSIRYGAAAVTTDHFLLFDEGARARRFRVRAVTNRDEADEELIIAAEEIADDEGEE